MDLALSQFNYTVVNGHILCKRQANKKWGTHLPPSDNFTTPSSLTISLFNNKYDICRTYRYSIISSASLIITPVYQFYHP